MMRNMFMQPAPSPTMSRNLTPEPEHEEEPSETTEDIESYSFVS